MQDEGNKKEKKEEKMNETLVSSLDVGTSTWLDVIVVMGVIIAIISIIFFFASVRKERKKEYAEKLVEEIKREDQENGRK